MILSSDRYFQTRFCTIIIQNLSQKIFHNSPSARAKKPFKGRVLKHYRTGTCKKIHFGGIWSCRFFFDREQSSKVLKEAFLLLLTLRHEQKKLCKGTKKICKGTKNVQRTKNVHGNKKMFGLIRHSLCDLGALPFMAFFGLLWHFMVFCGWMSSFLAVHKRLFQWNRQILAIILRSCSFETHTTFPIAKFMKERLILSKTRLKALSLTSWRSLLN